MAEHKVYLLALDEQGDGWALKDQANGSVLARFKTKGEGERFARDWVPAQGPEARLVVAETTAAMEDEADYGRNLKPPER